MLFLGGVTGLTGFRSMMSLFTSSFMALFRHGDVIR